MNRVFFSMVASVLLASSPCLAFDSDTRTSTLKIKSEPLGEQREIFVRLPRDYDRKGSPYPVVYVLDGEWNFELVAAYLDFCMDQGLYPDMIVTAVRNVDRNRDYVGAADARFPRSGGAERFLTFVESEWAVRIDRKYNSSDQRILVGHSFGGTLTLQALFQRPPLFDAYIAISASTWVADRYLFGMANDFFSSDRPMPEFVYMAVGEADGGATVPAGEEMAEVFDANAPDELEWSFEVLPESEHFLAFTAGIDRGFRKLFPRWQFEKGVGALARESGAGGVAGWFDEMEQDLGWRFRPSWFEMGVESIILAREGHLQAASELIARLRPHHPGNPIVLSFSGVVNSMAGDTATAEKHILEAIELTRERGLHPNWIQLENLQQQLDRVRGAEAANH